MPPISLLIKPASGSCNMRCDYCFYHDEQSKRKVANYGIMSDETLKNTIRKTVLKATGMCSIAFQGGEPTLAGLPYFRNAVKYAEQYRKDGLSVKYALQTNGYAINDEWCAFFKENNFLIGLSVDGNEKLHNLYRHSLSGQGSYEQVMKTSSLFDKWGVEYNILTVVNSATAAAPAEIYNEYKKRGWNWQQYIACLDPLGEEAGKRDFSLTAEAYGEFLIAMFDCWYKDYKKAKQPYIRQFENYVGILLGTAPESCDQRGICGIQYVVEADGSVYPCDFYMLDEYRLGNFNEDLTDKIDRKREEIAFVEKSRKKPGECAACEHYKLCRNGCMRCRPQQGGEAKLNCFCPSYKMFFDACKSRLYEIAEEVGAKHK